MSTYLALNIPLLIPIKNPPQQSSSLSTRGWTLQVPAWPGQTDGKAFIMYVGMDPGSGSLGWLSSVNLTWYSTSMSDPIFQCASQQYISLHHSLHR